MADNNYTPLFSIITPVYNNTKFLEESVKGLMNQDFDNFEHIIVDDGSTDGTSLLVDELASKYYPKIKTIHQNNQWIYASYNNGIKIAQGEYIFFLNSDDKLRHGILKYAAKRVEEYNHPDVLWTIMIMNACDNEQNIFAKDYTHNIGIISNDILLDSNDSLIKKWIDLYKIGIVNNPVNFYKRSLLLSHPFRNDVYAADLLNNIALCKEISSSVVLSLPAYDYYDYRGDINLTSTSGLKYYSYDHDLYNEIFNQSCKLLLPNGNLNEDSYEYLLKDRLSNLTKELYCIMDDSCKKTWAEKVRECIYDTLDDLVVDCAIKCNLESYIYTNCLKSIRNIMMTSYIKSYGTETDIYKVLDTLITLEKSGQAPKSIIQIILSYLS